MYSTYCSVIMAIMKSHYEYKDIINLEYFLYNDSDLTTPQRQKQDRAVYLQLEKEHGAERIKSCTPRQLLIQWVQRRVETEFSAPIDKSPGAVIEDSFRIAGFLTVLIGVVAGALGGLAFFTYTGATPVNVFQFLLLFLGSQLALTTIWIVTIFLRQLGLGRSLPSLYSSLLFGMVKRISHLLQKKWMNHVDAKKRGSVSQAIGLLKSRNKVYGSVFYWPLFCLSQFIGLGFNGMLLLTTLFKVTTTDLAFGWQSTIQISDQAVFNIVQAIAIPWSWFLESGIPTLEEIEGSRIVLKDGIYHLYTSDLVAWWPFLVFSLLVYGLFFRILLLSYGTYMKRRRLRNLKLDTPSFTTLLRRMTTPLVSTQAPPETKKTEELPTQKKLSTDKPATSQELVPQIVLIAGDINENYDNLEFNTLLQGHSMNTETTYPFQLSYEEDLNILDIVGNMDWHQERGVFIVMEGWMVPLVDFITYLGELRRQVADNTIITVALTGRPGQTVFTPLKTQEVQIWKKKIDAIGDPYLHLISLAIESEKP